MKNRPSQATRRARLAPLDHLKPGSRPRAEGDQGELPTQDPNLARETAEPAEPVTPGAGDTEAVQGKSTRSPAAVATRRHLEGSEQGPR